MKDPKTVSEHIIALYGHIKGLKREICSIRTNDLKHMHGDIDRLHTKIDRLLWWIIGGLGATMLTIVSVLL
jgi:L-rhamnose isomerase